VFAEYWVLSTGTEYEFECIVLNQKQIEWATPGVRTTQIISFALIMGVLIFGIIVSVIVPWKDVHSNFTIMAIVGLFAALSMTAFSAVLPRIISSSAAKANANEMRAADTKSFDEQGIKAIVNQVQSTNIVRMAMLEGAAFLNLVLFFVDKSVIGLVVAGICLLLLIIGFPTGNRLIGQIENQLDLVQDHLRAG
jgi:MFS family permease